jgi:Asp-tRNA(Asn)/Glu-tRNA(Gln) amidotransferase A subunit family amidase
MSSILELRRRIAAGQMDPAAAIAASRERIAARDGEVRAFASVARDVEAGPASALLGGIAVGVKDIIDTADLPTEMGCPDLYGGWRPRADAAIVSVLRRAGASVVGKTTTTAFAFLDPTGTANPAAPGRTPGGSSAGSAAAVAAGMVPLALGSQTGGSVIRPASFCGVAAIKCSFRLLPTVGVKPSAWTLDTLGLFAAGIPDLAYALEAMSGRPMPIDWPAGSPLRIGVLRQSYAGAPEPAGADALERALEACRRAGFAVTEAAEPPAIAQAFRAHPTINDYEMRVALGWEWERHRDLLPPKIRAALDCAQDITAQHYDAARGEARRARTACRELFADVDVLLSLSAPGPAPGPETTGDARFNRVLTLLGVPCVNVPGLVSSDGAPIGVQVIAPFGRDHLALAAAHRIAGALPET